MKTLVTLLNDKVLKALDSKLVLRSGATTPAPKPRAIGRRVIFFHPPKCGGTSVTKFLRTVLGNAEQLDPVASSRAASALGCPLMETREALLAYQAHRPGVRHISGHYFYSKRALAGMEAEFDLITVLRSPLERMLSLYYYNRFKRNREHTPVDLPLPAWLETPQAKGAAVTFTRMFVGDLARAATLVDDAGRYVDTVAAAEQAIANLRSFAVVGTLENIDAFAQAVSERYGVKAAVGHENENPKAAYPRFAEHSNEVQQRLREMCAADQMIYDAFSRRA